MELDDPRLVRTRLHGGAVVLPNSDAWRALARGELLDGKPVKSLEWVQEWLQRYSQFLAPHLGLHCWPECWRPLPLVRIGGSWFRVHFEDVICEHCDQRSGPSALLDYTEYYDTGMTHEEIVASCSHLEVKSCQHCGQRLLRRQTIWLAAEDAKDEDAD